MKKIRIQRQVSDDKAIKRWKTHMACRADCVEYTMWVLEHRNPDQEYRIHILDLQDKD